MRDDIHNKAPVSQALRALLRRCLREAERQESSKLLQCATKALSQEISRSIPQERLERICQAADLRLMFPQREISVRPGSRFEADFVSILNHDVAAPTDAALKGACAPHIERLSRETEAALLAAEPHSYREIGKGVAAFRSALTEVVTNVVSARLEGRRPCTETATLTPSTAIPLSPRQKGRNGQ